MADFLGPYGIRVNSVSPAVVASSIMGPDRIVSFLNWLTVTLPNFVIALLRLGA